MISRRERKLLQALNRPLPLYRILHSDTVLAVEELNRLSQEHVPERESSWRLSFAIKTAVRAFFSEVEGLSHAMCGAVADLGGELGVELTEKERLRILEQRRNKAGLVVSARLEPHAVVKLAFQWYPRLFGTTYHLDTSSTEWREFLTLKEVRDQFTHPKELDHLTAVNGLGRVGFCLAWFAGQMMFLLAECQRAALGGEEEGLHPAPKIPKMQPPPKHGPFFSQEDREVVRQSPAKSIAYFSEGVMALIREVGYPMDELRRMNLLSPEGQYLFRNLVRTLDSNLQGMLSFVAQYIEDAESRGEIALQDEEVRLLRADGCLEEQLPAVVNLWSAKFGEGLRVETAEPRYASLKRTRNVRNRIVHPKTVSCVRVTDEAFTVVMDAVGWYLDLVAPLDFDLDRLPIG